MRKIHLCQSVSGALKFWTRKDWTNIALDNNTTSYEIKKYFKYLEDNGVKVIPIGDRCEGFSDQTGCPGHIV